MDLAGPENSPPTPRRLLDDEVEGPGKQHRLTRRFLIQRSPWSPPTRRASQPEPGAGEGGGNSNANGRQASPNQIQNQPSTAVLFLLSLLRFCSPAHRQCSALPITPLPPPPTAAAASACHPTKTPASPSLLPRHFTPPLPPTPCSLASNRFGASEPRAATPRLQQHPATAAATSLCLVVFFLRSTPAC